MGEQITLDNLGFITSNLTDNLFNISLDLVTYRRSNTRRSNTRRSSRIISVLVLMFVVFMFKDTGTESGITTVMVVFMTVFAEFVSNKAYFKVTVSN
jgi:NhaP-type Na+/H+ or K+/H+ antiporter